MDKLTEEQKRIKLAEWDGLKEIHKATRKGNLDINGVRLVYLSESVGGWKEYSDVPNYFHDLNAVAKLEERLTNDQQIDYAIRLWQKLDAHGWGEERGWWIMATANAPKRCEAIGITIKLWEAGQ